MRLEEREYPPLETCKSENISLDQHEERSNPPRNWPTAVGLGKATDVPERTYLAASYPDASLHDSSANLHPKAGFKAKLNSTIMATFVLHSPPIKAVQSISKSELLQTFENFEGGLVDT